MDSAMVGGLVAVGAVILVALLARGMARKPPAGETPSPAPDPASPRARAGWSDSGNVATATLEADEDDEDDEDEGDDHIIAVTSLGEALVPHHHAVRLVPPEEQGEGWKVGAGIKSSNLRGEQALAMSWHAGDFTGLRVVRGEMEEGAWRLEALGREGEYTTFGFETREGADAAKLLFERLRIVQLGHDEDGNPMPPSAEQFAEARRIYLETEAALELPDDEDPR
jgi:hypothetical protein